MIKNMASSIDFIEFVCSQIRDLGEVRYRKMFGEYMIYLNEKPVILVCDNIPYVKKLPDIESLMQEAETGFPYDGAKEHYILDVEHKHPLLEVTKILEEVLPYPKKKNRKQPQMETERLILRPWKIKDAKSLYKYAKDPAVGPIAGWPPHTSVDNSKEVIRDILSAPETYAVVLKSTNEPVGSVGIMFGDGVHSTDMENGDAEIGYWIGVPYWGQGLIPEAINILLKRCFEELGINRVWCGHYDGNNKSRRVMEKCGFKFHHTEKGKTSPLGDIRTEHFTLLTKEDWNKIKH